MDTYLLGLSRTELLHTIGNIVGVTPETMRRRYYHLDYHDHPTALHILQDYETVVALVSGGDIQAEEVIARVRAAFQDEAEVAETIRAVNEEKAAEDGDSMKDVIRLVLPKLQRVMYDVVGNRREQAVMNLARAMEILDKYA